MSQFNLGSLFVTPGAIAASQACGDDLLPFLVRHTCGDWGDVDADDKKANDEDVKEGNRLLSSYGLSDGTKVWVITEGDRSATTVLLPDEY